jgi:hypothetical protein
VRPSLKKTKQNKNVIYKIKIKFTFLVRAMFFFFFFFASTNTQFLVKPEIDAQLFPTEALALGEY